MYAYNSAKWMILALVMAHNPLAAQALKGHNSKAPVDVDADRIEVQDRADRAVFAGNVHVRQEGLTLTAARLTVAYNTIKSASPQIDRLDAQGDVHVISADQEAHGQSAIYDLNHKIITMLGAVELRQGGSIVHGGRLVIDLNTGRSVIDGSRIGMPSGGGASATGGGRVTGHFNVPQHSAN